MRIELIKLTVADYMRDKDTINLQPQYQRGAAWKPARQVLLIDSILRGWDVPKLYFLRCRTGGAFAHDAVDGQQRLRAILEFREGKYSLQYHEPLNAVGGHPIAELHFNQLHKSLRDGFDAFELHVAEIIESDTHEVAALFARLQMGVSLNPAELRNAGLNPINRVLFSMAESHPFFLESRIPSDRYKRLDYLTHAYAMLVYQGRRSIKAPDLRKMVQDHGPDQAEVVLELASQAGDALNVLSEVNRELGLNITAKWIFVDLFWLISQRLAMGSGVDVIKLASRFRDFELLRKTHTARPEVLIEGRRSRASLDRHLYDYIMAFKSQGGLRENLVLRNEALRAHCPDIDLEA